MSLLPFSNHGISMARCLSFNTSSFSKHQGLPTILPHLSGEFMLHNDVIRHTVKILLPQLTPLDVRCVGYRQLMKQVVERHYFTDNHLGNFGRSAVRLIMIYSAI